MSKKRWTPIPAMCHVMIDGQVAGLILEPLPKSPAQTYVVKTSTFTRFIHEKRLTVRPESLRKYKP